MGLRDEYMKTVRLSNLPPEGQGWKTAKQIADDENIGVTTANRYLKALVDAGDWEKKIFQWVDAMGRPQSIHHYRPVKKGKAQ